MKLTKEIILSGKKLAHPNLIKNGISFIVCLPVIEEYSTLINNHNTSIMNAILDKSGYKNKYIHLYEVDLELDSYSNKGSVIDSYSNKGFIKLIKAVDIFDFIDFYYYKFNLDDDNWYYSAVGVDFEKFNQDSTEPKNELDEYKIDKLEYEIENLKDQIKEKDRIIKNLKNQNEYNNTKVLLTKDILTPFVREFELAINNESGETKKNMEALLGSLLSKMKNNGIEKVDCKVGDLFDYEKHHAIQGDILWDYSGKPVEGVIDDVLASGIKVDDKIISFPLVRVVKK